MQLLYKDYELPSIYLYDNGYLMNNQNFLGNDYWGKSTLTDNVKYIKTEDNSEYFHEANILGKINANEDNYFDFNKSIIDIGASFGCYSFRSAFKYVYAFEPNKMVYHLLNVNLMIHDKFFNAKTYNVCLSDKVETIEYDGFSVKKDGEVWNDLTHEQDDTRYIDSMVTHTLDEYNCENVGLIKVDVEGYEEKVLRGGLGTIIRNNYPPILFELWDVNYYGMTKEKHESIVKFLSDLGYKILWYWGDFETHLAIHN